MPTSSPVPEAAPIFSSVIVTREEVNAINQGMKWIESKKQKDYWKGLLDSDQHMLTADWDHGGHEEGCSGSPCSPGGS